jgi:hypothetical protein
MKCSAPWDVVGPGCGGKEQTSPRDCESVLSRVTSVLIRRVLSPSAYRSGCPIILDTIVRARLEGFDESLEAGR